MQLYNQIFERTQLERAFQRGFASSRLRLDLRCCPFRAEKIRAAWQAGWREGRASSLGAWKKARNKT